MIKIIAKIIFWVVVLYGCVLGGVYIDQRSMIYIRTKEQKDISAAPIDGIVEIKVQTEDGLTLTGWYKPARVNMPTMLRFHGNASNMLWSMQAMAPYIEQGYGALSAEYRGYSGNPGKPSEEGLYKDADAYFQWLRAQGILTNNIIVYGESIGTGPAVELAVRYPKLHMLVLQSPFTSLSDAAAMHYPYFPVQWLLKDRYDSLAKIEKIASPLLIVHGTNDRVIPYRLGKALFNAAPEPKSLITVDGADHNDLENFHIDEKILSALSE